MDAEITPEPPVDERDAILRAVEEQRARDPSPLAHRSLWREQGVRENVDDGALEEPS
jgi:hypothetical protein